MCALGQWPRADGTSYGTKTQIAPTVGRSSPETASQALPQQARGTLDARLASTEAGCASSPVGENAATVEWFGLFPRLASRCCRGCRQASPRRRGQCPGEALRCVGAGAARPSAGATPRARGKGRTPHIPRPSARAPFPPAWGDARMVTARPGHVWRSRGVHGAGVGRTRRRRPAWGPCRRLPADVTGALWAALALPRRAGGACSALRGLVGARWVGSGWRRGRLGMRSGRGAYAGTSRRRRKPARATRVLGRQWP